MVKGLVQSYIKFFCFVFFLFCFFIEVEYQFIIRIFGLDYRLISLNYNDTL